MATALAAPGDLDETFADNGLFSVYVGSFGSAAHAVLIQRDGKLVFAGDGYDGDFIVLRTDPDGLPDTGFAGDGIARADFDGSDDAAFAAIEQADGKLVLAGRAGSGRTSDIALARFTTNGSLDSSFGTAGRVTLGAITRKEEARSLVLQSDGKLVVAGSAVDDVGQRHFAFQRFDSSGARDPSFGNGALIPFDFGSGSESAACCLLQQADGKLLAIGTVEATSGRDVGVARLTENGLLDPSFGDGGRLTVDGGGDDEAFGAAIDSDGALVIVGHVSADGVADRALLMRLSPDGSRDETFGTAVVPAVSFRAVLLAADGRIVAAGYRERDGGGADMILARFDASGRLELSYGIDGMATADFGHADIEPVSSASGLVQQSEGRYVVVGSNALGTFGAVRFDDSAASSGRIGLIRTSVGVDETSPSVTYQVRRTGGRTGAATVDYLTSGGEAQPGSDFEDTSGTLHWSDGDASDQEIAVGIINDSVAEPDERFSLTLAAPTGGAQLAASEAATIIASEDGPGRLSIRFALDFWQVGEPDAGASNALKISVDRTGGSTGAVSVDYETVGGSATGGSDFESASDTLEWGDGDRSAKPIAVTILDDDLAEGEETFSIRLSNPTGGAEVALLGASITVHILDDDGTALVMTNSELRVLETAGKARVTVSRRGTSHGAVSVHVGTSPGSAVAGADFTAVSDTLEWADGDLADKSLEILIADDSEEEADETFTVTLSEPVGGPALGPPDSTLVTIADNDSSSGSSGGGYGGGAVDWLTVGFLGCLALTGCGSSSSRRCRRAGPAAQFGLLRYMLAAVQ